MSDRGAYLNTPCVVFGEFENVSEAGMTTSDRDRYRSSSSAARIEGYWNGKQRLLISKRLCRPTDRRIVVQLMHISPCPLLDICGAGNRLTQRPIYVRGENLSQICNSR